MGMFTKDPRPVVKYPKTEGRTKQSMKEECDINNILHRYKTTGHLTHVAAHKGRFADVSEVGDFQGAIERYRAASDFFSGLTAEMREEFGNDPAVFLDFMATADLDELEARGLAELKELEVEPEPVPDPVPEPE